jgi:NIMA (never in mitosis gene a)-related kinase
MTKAGEAKLGDMNVSKLAKKGLLYTQTGTPYYASPEVWKELPYDSKSDIWSLGCVIYEMSTLKPPFQAEDREGLSRKVMLGEYKPIPDFYSKDLCSVLDLMIQVNPAKRPDCSRL